MMLKVLSPEEFIYEGEVVLVQLPGSMGSFEILHNHAPLIARIDKGKIKIIDEGRNKFYLEVNSGIVEVKDNHIVVLTE
ncbi:MAG: ATP synthase F1 subunit epsilon [Bacteroidales bacterium]|nr:ATP synthase F1 subunit epsilon [Bacteroidales bacterium]